VIDTIARDDATKDAIVGPMFGDESPTKRVFPDTPIRDGASVTFDGVTFTVIDLGPSESPHDSSLILGADERIVFLGDQIYDHRHCFLADGFYAQWLANIEKLRARFPTNAVFHIGHGGPVGGEMWDWQRGYIETFVAAVEAADWTEPEEAKAAVVTRMKEYEPTDELQFLMELSIEPVAQQLGLISAENGVALGTPAQQTSSRTVRAWKERPRHGSRSNPEARLWSATSTFRRGTSLPGSS
jgi:glyoxylase-like metal-dependent hydrolase (beta-lactamase superfamily II)